MHASFWHPAKPTMDSQRGNQWTVKSPYFIFLLCLSIKSPSLFLNSKFSVRVCWWNHKHTLEKKTICVGRFLLGYLILDIRINQSNKSLIFVGWNFIFFDFGIDQMFFFPNKSLVFAASKPGWLVVWNIWIIFPIFSIYWEKYPLVI